MALGPQFFGRTRQNKLVHFSDGAHGAEGPAKQAARTAKRGDLITVRIDRTSTWALMGAAAGEPVLATKG